MLVAIKLTETYDLCWLLGRKNGAVKSSTYYASCKPDSSQPLYSLSSTDSRGNLPNESSNHWYGVIQERNCETAGEITPEEGSFVQRSEPKPHEVSHPRWHQSMHEILGKVRLDKVFCLRKVCLLPISVDDFSFFDRWDDYLPHSGHRINATLGPLSFRLNVLRHLMRTRLARRSILQNPPPKFPYTDHFEHINYGRATGMLTRKRTAVGTNDE